MLKISVLKDFTVEAVKAEPLDPVAVKSTRKKAWTALAIGLWALLCKHYGILLLQFFYASAGIIGVWRWF